MISTELLTALQEQLTTERTNAAIYRNLAACLEAAVWPGSAKWMLNASNEEQSHADRIAAYIIDRGGIPWYAEIPAQSVIIAEMLPCFAAALEVEQATTEKLKVLYYIAEAGEDPQTMQVLWWYLAEQTESERVLTDILTEIQRADCSAALLILDREYGGDT